MNQNPLVTIRCITYNHAPYICDAIEGFLMQNTSFPFEILIHDDASTDGTAEIVKEYESKYPHLIKAVYQKENQYSKGIRVAQYLSPLIRGKYIALCEGDDYWTDPKKLEKQVKILEERVDLDMCIHSAFMTDLKNNKKEIIGQYKNENGIVSIEEIIERKSGMIPTASTFIRKHVSKEMDDFFMENPWNSIGDIFLHFFGGYRGGAYYIDEPMSFYRKFVKGSYNERFENNGDLRKKHAISILKSYDYLNFKTNKLVNKSFKKFNSQLLFSYLKSYKELKKDRLELFIKYFYKLPIYQIIISIIILVTPTSMYINLSRLNKSIKPSIQKLKNSPDL